MTFPGVFPMSFFKSAAAGGIIVSIQPFEITIATSATSNTATISSVSTSTSVIFFAGFETTHTGASYREFMPRVELTNATTVTVIREQASATHTVTVRGTVVEFAAAAIASVQTGTITIGSGDTSGTATISAVDMTTSAIFYYGSTGTTSGTSPQNFFCRLDLTNSTTVTGTRAASSTVVVTLGFAIVEFNYAYVRSVQRRSVTYTSNSTTDADTIASVTTGNALLLYNGTTSNTSTITTWFYNAELTSSTNVNLVRAGTATTSRTFNYTVLEFAGSLLTSVQRDTTAMAGVSSADATISTVDTSKTVANWTGWNTDGSDAQARYSTAKLLGATTIRVQRDDATDNNAVGWEAAQFSTSNPAAVATVLLSDIFVDANTTSIAAASHRMNVGSGWTIDAGTITINSNRARTGSAPGTATADAGESDIIGSVIINATSDLGGAGFAIRHSNTSNYWIPWVDYNASTFDLYEVNAGSASVRASRSFNPAATTDYTIRVQCYGQTLVATIDGANYLAYPLAALNETNTRFGIRGFRTTAENHDFDDFIVYPGPTPLLIDNFTDTNGTAIASHTPDSNPNGGSWTAHSGTWDIQSNALNSVTTPTAPNGDCVSISISSADCIIVATMTAAGNHGIGIRVSNNSNFWLARLTSGNSLQLFRREAGSYTLEASATVTSVSPYTLAVVCVGDTISVHIGTTIITKTSATFNQTAARVGFVAIANSQTFDNLKVLPL